MVRASLAIALSLIATTAVAQHVHDAATEARLAAEAAMGGERPVDWRTVRPAPCSFWEGVANSHSYCDARQIAARRKSVLDLVKSGRCDDARRAAIDMNDLSMAGEIVAVCRPSDAPGNLVR